MKERVDTLVRQSKSKYALRSDLTEKGYIKEITDGLEAPSAYLPLNIKLNKEGTASSDIITSNHVCPSELETLPFIVTFSEGIHSSLFQAFSGLISRNMI